MNFGQTTHCAKIGLGHKMLPIVTKLSLSPLALLEDMGFHLKEIQRHKVKRFCYKKVNNWQWQIDKAPILHEMKYQRLRNLGT